MTIWIAKRHSKSKLKVKTYSGNLGLHIFDARNWFQPELRPELGKGRLKGVGPSQPVPPRGLWEINFHKFDDFSSEKCLFFFRSFPFFLSLSLPKFILPKVCQCHSIRTARSISHFYQIVSGEAGSPTIIDQKPCKKWKFKAK